MVRFRILLAVVACASAVSAYMSYKKVTEEEAMKREIIKLNMNRELLACDIATQAVLKKIKDGEYTSASEALIDLEFTRIVILG